MDGFPSQWPFFLRHIPCLRSRSPRASDDSLNGFMVTTHGWVVDSPSSPTRFIGKVISIPAVSVGTTFLKAVGLIPALRMRRGIPLTTPEALVELFLARLW